MSDPILAHLEAAAAADAKRTRGEWFAAPAGCSKALTIRVSNGKYSVPLLYPETRVAGEVAMTSVQKDPAANAVFIAACSRVGFCELLARVKAADSLLRELIDTDQCRYDHHGYCQAHSLNERPCPHERAKKLLAQPEPYHV